MNKLYIKYGISNHICCRKYMEDYFKHCIEKKFVYFSILDGHGNDSVAKYVKDILFTKIYNSIHKLNNNNYKDFFTNICLEIDEDIKQNLLSYKISGTTYIGFIIYNNYVYIVNIGDSIININFNNKIIFENTKHIPSNNIEKERIIKSKFNVINGRINNCINISRCFGDFRFKPYILHKECNPIVVIPDVSKINLDILLSNKTFILLASDGILLQKKTPLLFLNNFIYHALLKGYHPQTISDYIVQYFVKNNNQDNLTLFIIILKTIPVDQSAVTY